MPAHRLSGRTCLRCFACSQWRNVHPDRDLSMVRRREREEGTRKGKGLHRRGCREPQRRLRGGRGIGIGDWGALRSGSFATREVGSRNGEGMKDVGQQGARGGAGKATALDAMARNGASGDGGGRCTLVNLPIWRFWGGQQGVVESGLWERCRWSSEIGILVVSPWRDCGCGGLVGCWTVGSRGRRWAGGWTRGCQYFVLCHPTG